MVSRMKDKILEKNRQEAILDALIDDDTRNRLNQPVIPDEAKNRFKELLRIAEGPCSLWPIARYV